MGSSSKSGSGTTRHYYASIPALVGWGPIDGISDILLNGERVWTGTLHRLQATNPVNLTTKYGTIRFYWGTEDQPADPLCPGRRYKGVAYLMFVDFDHGQATNAYNTEVILLGGAPQQSIVTGAAAQASYANGIAVNPIALAAEILTSPLWRGLDVAKLDAASFQALADAVPAATAISPLYNDAADLRSVLLAATGMVDGWLRRTPAGLIQAGRWNDSAVISVTTLTHDDFTETPSYTEPDADADVPNSYAVEFVDRTALHKEAKIAVNDDAALAQPGAVLNRKTLSASHLITYEQADLAGHEALRRAAELGKWAGSIRIGKARTPEGARIQPGDYLRVPLSQAHEATQRTQLIRVQKVVWPRDATAGVKVEADRAPVVQPSLALAAAAEPVAEIPASVPPINRARVFALPSSAAGVQPPIYIVAARPADTALGFSIHFDTELAGDFPEIERSTGYALPVTIGATISAADTSLTLVLRPVGAYGENFQRDASLLRDWTGGATQGRNDELLVVLVNTDDTVEIASVAGTPPLTEAGTFTVPVLRARLGTASASHASAAEAWVVHSTSLAAIEHADIMAAASSGATLYFRPGAYTLRTPYAPAEAYTEQIRRTEAEESLAEYAAQPDSATWVPMLTLVIPAGYLPPGDDEPLPGTLDDLLGNGFFGEIPTFALEGRTEDLPCSLCGLAEYDPTDGSGTSMPPKRYLLETWSGEGGCSNPGYQHCVMSGSVVVDPSTCTQSDSTQVNGAAPAWTGSDLYCLAQLSALCSGVTITETRTRTVRTRTYTREGTCEYCGTISATWVRTRSDEDTEANGRARAEAVASWSEWASTLAAAAYEERTTTVTWSQVLLQYRGSGSGATPGWVYEVIVHTELQPYGDTEAAWTTGADEPVQLTAATDGTLTLSARELLCPRGYRRRISGVSGPRALHGPEYTSP